MPTADEVIAKLGLAPHPEGGHYRETFRDPREITAESEHTTGSNGTAGRAASTAIYFLLTAGQISRWHRVDAAEVWHWYAGAPLELRVAPGAAQAVSVHTLGNDLMANEAPQIVVPTGHWQQAQSLGDWTLVGCTVAPGFAFAGFEMAPHGFEPGAPQR